MVEEIFKSLNTGTVFDKYYEISSIGRLKKTSRKSIAKYGKDTKERFIVPKIHIGKGYLRTRLTKSGYKKQFYFHRLVALSFIPNPQNKPCINHKNAIKDDNRVENLEWCTDAENNEHAKRMGLFEGANSKIPKDQRRFIKENFLKIGRFKLAEQFGLPDDYVLSVAKVKVRGTSNKKKAPIRHKEIVNIETGETYISDQLARKLNTNRKEVLRMISEERKPNTSPYRYTGKYIKAIP